MKKARFIRPAISLLLSLTVILSLTSAASANSPAYGVDMWLKDINLQDGVVLSDNIFWSEYYSQPRRERYITYTPGYVSGGSSAVEAPLPGEEPGTGEEGSSGAEDIPSWLNVGRMSTVSYASGAGIVPVAAYGSSVCDRITASSVASYYEGMGYRVLGVINGDFYDVSTGFPLGLLVSDGELLSSAGGYYAIGFRPDGSAVIGQPELAVTAQAGGQTLRLAGYNKPRVENAGVTLLTHDFRNDHTTATTTAGVSVAAAIVGGKAVINGQLVLQVEEVWEGNDSRAMREDQVVLTASAGGYDEGLGFLRSLTPGQTVTISFTETSNPAWGEVTEAIGALYMLVENGVANSDFEVSAAPRTAVGVKANGDVVLYTIDGRQTGYSMGASLNMLALRMQELGCVTALCLDGGGSTTMVSSLPDSSSAKVINSPSDKSERRVTNHIALLAPGGATGIPYAINASANAPAVLAGHTIAFTANVVDTHYYPTAGDVHYSADRGQISGNVLTAPAEGGIVKVTAASGSISSQLDVLVVDAPDQVSIQRNGQDVTYLTVSPGEKVSLGVSASYHYRELEASPSDFEWKMTPELGTIDGNGVLTAALVPASGYITVSRGNCSTTIAVSIQAGTPFADMAGHWADSFITQLYYQGILTGETAADGKVYARPDRSVTRAEFAVLLSRYLELDTMAYTNTITPFADINKVDTWARDAVKAMYALGIVNGTEINGQQVFDPQGTLSRAQAVTMLGRMLELYGENGEPNLPDLPDGGSLFLDLNTFDPDEVAAGQTGTTEPSTSISTSLEGLTQFSDASEIPPYAIEHFRTLVELGVINGDKGRLTPNDPMTRAAVCKVLVTMP